MEQVADRHSGDLGGKLSTFDPTKAVTVKVRIGTDWARSASGQHAIWMLLNLLARAEGIVVKVHLECPDRVTVLNNVVPFGSAGFLRERLIEAVDSIAVVPIVTNTDSPCDRTIIVGPGSSRLGEIGVVWMVASGWWGGVAYDKAPPSSWGKVDPSSSIPFGPYMSASLAAGDVFLSLRDPGYVSRARAGIAGWNAWSDTRDLYPNDFGPSESTIDLSGVALAGVGAVGAAWMHAIWAVPGATGGLVVADSDIEGVSTTNLNRGVLFTRSDIHRPKAAVAAQAARGSIEWKPVSGPIEASHVRGRLLISAVDSNTSRDNLQAMYPTRFLSGSTRNLRAEVILGGVPGEAACLRCYNRPEGGMSDVELRAHLERDTSEDLEGVAASVGADVADFRSRVMSGACDSVTDRYMALLRSRYGESAGGNQFSVGFVSAAAGTLLAATTVKYLSGDLADPGGASRQMTFQFERPTATTNGVADLARDETCPRCGLEVPAFAVWQRRYEAWGMS